MFRAIHRYASQNFASFTDADYRSEISSATSSCIFNDTKHGLNYGRIERRRIIFVSVVERE